MTAAMHDWQDTAHGMAWGQAYPIESVVVPLDGSSVAKVALPVARSLADLERATLHVLYVGKEAPDKHEPVQQLGLSHDELHGAVLHRGSGTPAQAIMHLVRALSEPLIVMCTHMGDARRRACLGSVADAVLTAGPSRVLLVVPEQGGELWSIRRVLLAHDGTPSADVAIAPAAHIAHRAGAEAIALHVAARQAHRPTEPGSLPAPRYLDQPQHEWPAWANEFVQRMLTLGQAPAAVNFKLLVAGGQAGSEVAQFARDHHADLVVLAWHGRWESRREGALKTIVRRSGCPVLLIGAPPIPAKRQ